MYLKLVNFFKILDWKRFPSELKIRTKKKKSVKTVKPNLNKGKVKVKEDVTKTFEVFNETVFTTSDHRFQPVFYLLYMLCAS